MPESFDSRLARYFDGDLDAVERLAFERDLAQPALRARFDAAWDARVAADGFLALRAPDPDLRACFSFETLEAYVHDQLTPGEAELVEAHLACPLCAVQVDGLKVDGRRSAPDRSGEAASLVDRLRDWLRPGVLIPVGVAVAALAFFLLRPPAGPDPDEFTARGTPPAWASRVGVELRVGGRPLTDTLPASAAVDVLVRNATEEPTWVMIFGIDARGEIDWYFPAWTDPAADPSAIRLPPGETRLPEAVAFDRPPGAYRLVAWFTRAPGQVQAVEAALDRGGLKALVGGHLQVLDLKITP